jgi:agarase
MNKIPVIFSTLVLLSTWVWAGTCKGQGKTDTATPDTTETTPATIPQPASTPTAATKAAPISCDIQAAKKVDVVNVNAHLNLDSYGGSQTLQGHATGWFSLQKVNGRWWLVSPDGHGMISLGVVHILQGAVQPIYQVAYKGDSVAYAKDVADNLRRWGFNSAGYGSVWKSRDLAMASELPFMVSMEDLLGISRFSKAVERPDLFDAGTRQMLAGRIAEHVNPVKTSKNLIGYFYVDAALQWNLGARKKGSDWATAYRKLPATAPGKAQYIDFLLARHQTAAAIDPLYGTNAADRAALLAETTWSTLNPDDPAVIEDDKAFAAIAARQYYMICHDEIRKLDPNHLIFGDRYFGTDIPNLDQIFKEAAPYVDVISIQPFDKDHFSGELYDKVAEETGKPILFCDFAVDFATPQYPQGMWGSWPTEDKAADIYAQYLDDAFNKPYMIGIHRCTYIDLPRGNVLKQGLVQQNGQPYTRTVQRYAEIHQKLYERLYNTTTKPQ